MTTAESLRRTGNELGDAINDHSRVLAESADDYPAVVQAIGRLRAAAMAYVIQISELSGWSNPFTNLELELNTDDSSGEPNDLKSRAEGSAVKVEATYRLMVKDIEAARRLLSDSGGHQEFSAQISPSIATDVVTDLFLANGWDPSQYGDDVIEVVDQKWECGPDGS